ncbi:MAG TPA: hypothetical protein VGC72_14620 [Candidatus Elarobacter sp.]
MLFLSAVLIVLPITAAANGAAFTPARWTRTLAASVRPPSAGAPVMQALSDDALLIRNGAGVLAVDARGAARWSMPDVEDAVSAGDAVVFRRSNVIFAVRSRDAGVLWKRACANAPYFVVAEDRIVTMCDGLSTVLRASDGSVLARRAARIATSPPSIRGARPLNAGYVLVTNFFDGAWMGQAYYVVDARTGAFLWSETDCDVVEVTPTTISVTPYPSMLPWGPSGEVVRRRLSDGAKLHSETYAPPKDADPDRRGNLVMTGAAAYVTTNGGTLFRFRRGDTRHPQQLWNGQRLTTVTLGNSAFILTSEPSERDGGLYLDRPSAHGTFATRALGRHQGYLGIRSPGSSEPGVDMREAVRLGNRIAVPDGDVVRLYDEFGAIEMAVTSACTNPQLATSRTTLFVRCGKHGEPASLTAFARP